MTSPPTLGRSGPQLLLDRNFGPFVAGKVLASSGTWIQQIAAAVLMFQLTRSAFLVGVATGLTFAGPLVLALWTGSLTDRYDRRMLLMVGRVISGAPVGLLAIAIIWRGMDGFGGVPVVLATAAAMGVGQALSVPAMQALTPALVPDEDLEQALAFSAIAPSIARAIGPAAGAALLYFSGPGGAFAAAALAHLTFVAVLSMITARPQVREATRPRLLGGLRYLWQTRAALLILGGVALLGFAADPVITLTPPLADRLGGGSQLVGVFAAVFGAGAVVIVLAFRSLRRVLSLRWVGVAGFVTASIGLAVTGLIHSPVAASIGFLLNGAGFMLATVALTSRIQRRVPDQLRGRVMALWGVAFLGSRPLAAPINGALADTFSVAVALLFVAVLVLAAAPLALARYDPAPTTEPEPASAR